MSEQDNINSRPKAPTEGGDTAEAVAPPTASAGLIPWHGGNCPVAPETPVRLHYRGPVDDIKGVRIVNAPAGRLDWSHDGNPDDIVAYEVLKLGDIEVPFS